MSTRRRLLMNAMKDDSCASERSTSDWRKTRGREKRHLRTKQISFFFFVERLMIKNSKKKQYTLQLYIMLLSLLCLDSVSDAICRSLCTAALLYYIQGDSMIIKGTSFIYLKIQKHF